MLGVLACRNAFKSSAFSGYQQLRFAQKYIKNKTNNVDSPRRKGRFTKDEHGRYIRRKKPKSLGTYVALPVQDLTHPVFQSEERQVRKTLDLPTFSPDILTKDMVGKAAAFSITDKDPVRRFGLSKKMLLEFRLLSTPCSVIRDVTLQTAEIIDAARDKSSLDTRAVFTGSAGCGKSFLLFQAVEHCMANGWIVIYIPRGVNLVNSTTSYEYNLRTRTYVQPAYSFQTLQRMQTVNQEALRKLTLSKRFVFEKREVSAGTNLFDFIDVALKDASSAPVILDALMAELSLQTKYPVLLAVDDFQALFCRTTYRDQFFTPIRPYHLSVPRLILEFASGRRAFGKGAFLGAVSASSTTYPTPIDLQEALSIPPIGAPSSPYDKNRSRVLREYTKGLQTIPVPDQLSVPEAAALFEVWMKDLALGPSTYDEMFLAKYTESSGNAREFVWKGLLASLQS